jgi:hypothetical protein
MGHVQDVGEDLFDPKSDIKLQINPTNFMKQGASRKWWNRRVGSC